MSSKVLGSNHVLNQILALSSGFQTFLLFELHYSNTLRMEVSR